jgi:hypothetical protein
MGRRICIVGFSDVNRAWGGNQPKDVEVWALNEVSNCTAQQAYVDDQERVTRRRCACYNPHRCTCTGHDHEFIKRYDRLFQLHPRDWKEDARLTMFENKGMSIHPKDRNVFGRNENHVLFLRECDKPVYMRKKWRDIPNAVRYPFGEITKTFGIKKMGRKWLYSTSTPAYMFALALLEHVRGETVDEIRIAGIEFSIGTEYFWQRPAMEFYMGIAMGLGINLKFPPQGSAMLSAPRYALDEPVASPTDFTHQPIDIPAPTPEQLEEFPLPEIAFAEAADGD